MSLNSVILDYGAVIIVIGVLYMLYQEYKKKSKKEETQSNKAIEHNQCVNCGAKYNYSPKFCDNCGQSMEEKKNGIIKK